MNKYLQIIGVLISLVMFSSCSSDDDSSSGENANVWVVYLQGTGDGGVDIQYGNETFCYEDGECESISGFSFVGTFGDSKLEITSSDADRIASGVLIENIEIVSGTGKIEIVAATVKEVDGFEMIEDGASLFTSPELSSGETYTLEFGEINND